jgi:hypothetical protein
MDAEFSPIARRLGIVSAATVAALLLAYAVTLAAGFASLESRDEPIGDPYFALLELLIILMMPAMVLLMAAVYAWAPAHRKILGLVSLVFMAITAALTCTVHVAILTLSRQADVAQHEYLPRLLSFEWPSLAYALDILAWDFFFALSMLFASGVFSGSRLARSIRAAMLLSGVLALAGLSGVVTGVMALRNIGIAGYVGVFLVVVLLLGVLFHRSVQVRTEGTGTSDPRTTGPATR